MRQQAAPRASRKSLTGLQFASMLSDVRRTRRIVQSTIARRRNRRRISGGDECKTPHHRRRPASPAAAPSASASAPRCRSAFRRQRPHRPRRGRAGAQGRESGLQPGLVAAARRRRALPLELGLVGLADVFRRQGRDAPLRLRKLGRLGRLKTWTFKIDPKADLLRRLQDHRRRRQGLMGTSRPCPAPRASASTRCSRNVAGYAEVTGGTATEISGVAAPGRRHRGRHAGRARPDLLHAPRQPHRADHQGVAVARRGRQRGRRTGSRPTAARSIPARSS